MVEKFLADHPLSGSTFSGLLLKLGIPPSEHPALLRQPRGDRSLVRSEKRRSPESKLAAALRLKLVAANAAPQVSGMEELPGKSNYFRGSDPRKWRTDVATYAKVKYAGVYPGVDLVYYGNQGQLEYDFIVAPGAKPSAIALSLQGAERVNVDAHLPKKEDLSFYLPSGHRRAWVSASRWEQPKRGVAIAGRDSCHRCASRQRNGRRA